MRLGLSFPAIFLSLFLNTLVEGFSFFARDEGMDIFVLFVHRAQAFFCVDLVQNAVRVLFFVCQILLDLILVVIEHYLFVKQLLVLICLKTKKFKVKVKRWHLVAHRLVVFEMQILHVRVGKSFSDCDALIGVENKHFFDEVNCFGVGRAFEKLVEILSFAFG